mgnify:CR=1 FL=1
MNEFTAYILISIMMVVCFFAVLGFIYMNIISYIDSIKNKRTGQLIIQLLFNTLQIGAIVIVLIQLNK